MRFLKQKDQFSCGPLALVNALKWCGRKSSLKELKTTLQTTRTQGTSHRVLSSTICKVFNTHKISSPTTESIENHLSTYGSLLLQYEWTKSKKGHIVLIIGQTNHYYYVVNYLFSKTVSRVSKSTIELMIKSKPSFAWYLSR